MNRFVFSGRAWLIMLLLSMTACVARPERRVLESRQSEIQYNSRTGKLRYNRKPIVSLLGITKPGLRVTKTGTQTVLLKFALKVERGDYWLKPGDVFIFTYQDYTEMPGRSTELRLLIDKDDEVAQHSIGSMDGGQLFVRLFAPVEVSAGQTRYFSLVMDTTMYEENERLFFSLKEYRSIVNELVGCSAACDISTIVMFR